MASILKVTERCSGIPVELRHACGAAGEAQGLCVLSSPSVI